MKEQLRKLLALFLSFFMLFTSMPVSALAEATSEGWTETTKMVQLFADALSKKSLEIRNAENEKIESFKLFWGETRDLKAVFSDGTIPAGANPEWSSDHPEVATVDQNGHVSLTFTQSTDTKSQTKATITATLRQEGKTYSASVTVQADTATLSFDANGGTGSVQSIVVAKEYSVTLPDRNDMVRSGFTFMGWGKYADSGIAHVQHVERLPILHEHEALRVDEDLRLYAVWAQPMDAIYFIRLDGQAPVEPCRPPQSAYTQGMRGRVKYNIFYADAESGVDSHLEAQPSVADIRKACNAKAGDVKFTDGSTYNKCESDKEFSDNYYVRWYVVKKDNEDEPHVDGVLLKRSLINVSYKAGEGLSLNDYTGELPETKQYSPGSDITVESQHTLARPGYTFAGWKCDFDDETHQPNDVVHGVNKNVVFTAQWTPNAQANYTVEYYYQENGSYDVKPDVSEPRTEKIGMRVYVTPEDKKPTKTGYVLDTSRYDKWDGPVNLEGTLVLKVYFKQQFTVTYLPGEHGTFQEQKTENLDYGVNRPAAPGEPGGVEITSKEGYVFNGWNPKLEKNVTKDMVYTAQWIPITYKVNYLEETTNKVLAKQKEKNAKARDSITSEKEKISIPGYTYKTADPTTLTVSEAIDSNVINLYYTANTDTAYTVEYYYQNETDGTYPEKATEKDETRTGTTAEEVEVTDADKTPSTGHTGYVFDETNTGNVLSGVVAGNGSLVLKVYFKKQYTVTYKPGNHGTFEEQTNAGLNYGAKRPEAPGEPDGEPSGEEEYAFAGWEPSLENLVTKDMVYTAQWTKQTYTVKHYYQTLNDDSEIAWKEAESLTDENAVWRPQTTIADVKGAHNKAGSLDVVDKHISGDGHYTNYTLDHVKVKGKKVEDTQKVTNGDVVELYYTRVVERTDYSDGIHVTANDNGGNDGPDEIRQGKITIVTHYVGGSLNGQGKSGDLYFRWRNKNCVDVLVNNSADGYIINTVVADVRTDGKGIMYVKDGEAKLDNVEGASTVHIYLTPLYQVTYTKNGTTYQTDPTKYTCEVTTEGAGTIRANDNGYPTSFTTTALPSDTGYSCDGWYNVTPKATPNQKFGEQTNVSINEAKSTDASELTITLNCATEALTVDYTVEFYYENEDGTFTIDNGLTATRQGTFGESAAVGETDKTDPKHTKNGLYEFDGENRENVLKVDRLPAAGTTLKLYFKRAVANYTIYHYLDGTEIEVADPDTASKKIGETVTAVAKTEADLYADYKTATSSRFDPQASITIDKDASKNIIKVYYKIPLIIKANTKTHTYDGQPKTVVDTDGKEYTVTGLLSGDTISTPIEIVYGEDDAPNKTNVGEYDAKVTPSAEGIAVTNKNAPVDYYAISTAPGKLEIVKSTESVKVKIVGNQFSTDYDGNEHEAKGYTYTLETTDGTKLDNTLVTVTAKNGEPTVKETNAGTYPMGLTKESFEVTSDSYANITVEVTDGGLEIKRLPVTVTANNASKGYGTDDPTLTAKVEGTLAGEENQIKYDLIRAEGEDVGRYTITASGEPTQGNYTVTYNPGVFEIVKNTEPVKVKIVGNQVSTDYDGNEHEAKGYTYTLETMDGTQLDNVLVTVTAKNGEPTVRETNAGTYPMGLTKESFEVTSDSYANITVEVTDGGLEIKRLPVTVTANNASKGYGTDDPTLTAKVEGTLAGEENQIKYDLIRAEGEDVGTYEITASGEPTQGNYTVTYNPGVFEIVKNTEPVKVKIVGNQFSMDYDGNEHEAKGYTYTLEAMDGTPLDNALVTVTAKNGEPTVKETNAGTYPMGLTKESFEVTSDSYANITVEVTDGGLEIKRLPVTLTSATLSKTYDGTALVNGETPLEEETGWVDGEGATYTFTGSQLLVGSSDNAFQIEAKDGTNLDNYVITSTFGALIVTDGTDEDPVDPSRVVTKTHDSTTEYKLGDTVTFTIQVTNIYNEAKKITLKERPGVVFANGTTEMVFENVAPGDTITTTATYTITEADLRAGEFVNTIQAGFEGGKEFTNTDTVTPETPNVHLALTKTLDNTPERGYFIVGETAEFTITVTNEGNQTLTNVVVNEQLEGAVIAAGDNYTVDGSTARITSLAPNTSVEIKATYQITLDDLRADETAAMLRNIVTATGESPEGVPDPEEVTAEVEVPTDTFTEIAGTKVWNDEDNAFGTRPEAITLALYSGQTLLNEVRATAESGWTYTFGKLPTHDADGNVIPYLVQDEVTGYDAEMAENYQVTNTLKRYTLTVRYWYDRVGGMEASATVMRSYFHGQSYNVVSPGIAGYTADQARVTGVMTGDAQYDVVYTRNNYTITVNYVYQNGTIAAPTYTDTLGYDDAYFIPSPVLRGYTANARAIAGSMEGRNVVYTVIYVPDNVTVVIDEYGVPLGIGAVEMNVGDCFE